MLNNLLTKMFITSTQVRALKSRYTLDMFHKEVSVSDDEWNKIKNGEIKVELKDHHDMHQIGFIRYRKYVGQLGLLFITDKDYMNRGLGTQLVDLAIGDMKSVNVKEVWAVTRDEHPFWSKHLNYTKRDPAHHTITASGYYKTL